MRLALFSLISALFATCIGTIAAASLALPIATLLSGGNVPLAILGAILGAPLTMMLSMDALRHMLPTVVPMAAVVGGAVQTLGRTRPWLRRRRAWAGGGAFVGALVYAAMKWSIIDDATTMLNYLATGHWQLAPVALGGAAAALAFRAAFHILNLFFAPDALDDAL